jgi:hypothetical protein
LNTAQPGKPRGGTGVSVPKLPRYVPIRKLASENDEFSYELRELHYGLGLHPTHRAVFTIVSDIVVVLTIRHGAQRPLSPGDIATNPTEP